MAGRFVELCGGRLSPPQGSERTLTKSTNGALAAAAAGALLLGGAGMLAFATPGAINVSQRQWAVLIVAIGVVGYTVAMLVALFGTRGLRHVRS